MALDSKKSGFGFDLEEKFKDVKVTDTDTHTHTYTDTPTQTHTSTPTYPKKETRSRRLNLTTKPSMFEKVNNYALSNGDTFNGLINKLMEEFIEKNGL